MKDNNDHHKLTPFEADLIKRFEADHHNPDLKWQMGQHVMDDKYFNDLLNATMEATRELLNKNKLERCKPTACIVGRSNKGDHKWENINAGVIEVPDSSLEKVELFEALGKKIATERPDFWPVVIHFVSETWTSETSNKTLQADDEKYTRPSENSDRTEQVMVMGRTIDGRHNLVGDEIVRRADNTIKLKPQTYMPFVKGADNTLDSPMLNGFFKGWAKSTRFGEKAK